MKTPPYEDGLSGPVSPITEAQRAAINALLAQNLAGWAWYRGLRRMQCVSGIWSYWLHVHTWDGCRLECFNDPANLIRFLQEESEPVADEPAAPLLVKRRLS